MQGVQAPVIPLVAALIRQHPGTISLGQGVVHYAPPPEAAEEIQRFLADSESHKYQPVEGIEPLLDALERKLAAENGIDLGERSALLVTAGGNMGFLTAILAACDTGDEVILPAPYYFNHHMAIALACCTPVVVPTDSQYQLDLDYIRRAVTPRTRAIVTVSPNNPTGAVYPAAALTAVNALCSERGLLHIHDEAYEYFTYGGTSHFSPGSLPGAAAHTISIFSLSKSYGFASWRIGYMTLPVRLLEAARKILDTMLICPPVISQYAAVGALRAGTGWVRERVAEKATIRDCIAAELSTLGDCAETPPAEGAFYFLPRVRSSLGSMELVERLVREHRVAAIPGDAFGLHGCALRISYGALTAQTAAEGIGRLVEGVRRIAGG